MLGNKFHTSTRIPLTGIDRCFSTLAALRSRVDFNSQNSIWFIKLIYKCVTNLQQTSERTSPQRDTKNRICFAETVNSAQELERFQLLLHSLWTSRPHEMVTAGLGVSLNPLLVLLRFFWEEGGGRMQHASKWKHCCIIIWKNTVAAASTDSNVKTVLRLKIKQHGINTWVSLICMPTCFQDEEIWVTLKSHRGETDARQFTLRF